MAPFFYCVELIDGLQTSWLNYLEKTPCKHSRSDRGLDRQRKKPQVGYDWLELCMIPEHLSDPYIMVITYQMAISFGPVGRSGTMCRVMIGAFRGAAAIAVDAQTQPEFHEPHPGCVPKVLVHMT
jgi:hypothetical protein